MVPANNRGTDRNTAARPRSSTTTASSAPSSSSADGAMMAPLPHWRPLAKRQQKRAVRRRRAVVDGIERHGVGAAFVAPKLAHDDGAVAKEAAARAADGGKRAGDVRVEADAGDVDEQRARRCRRRR